MKKNDRARIHSFEIWAYRRLLRVSLTEKRPNKSVLEEIGEFLIGEFLIGEFFGLIRDGHLFEREAYKIFLEK